MENIIKFCESWNIPFEDNGRKVYGERTITVNEKLIITKCNFTCRYGVKLKGEYDDLNKYGQIYGVIRLIKDYNSEYFDAYKNRRCYIPYYTGYYEDLGAHQCQTCIDMRKERIEKGISECGSYSLFDENGLYSGWYCDYEYEEPDKDTFKKCYEDSCIGWDSSDGFEMKLTTDDSHGVVACLYYPETKVIKSRYNSWKDIAEMYYDNEITEHEKQIEELKKGLSELLKEE